MCVCVCVCACVCVTCRLSKASVPERYGLITESDHLFMRVCVCMCVCVCVCRLSKASVPERYVLMAESDHLFMRPLPNMMRGEVPAAALFSYMLPADYPEILRMLLGDITDAQVSQMCVCVCVCVCVSVCLRARTHTQCAHGVQPGHAPTKYAVVLRVA